jgi:hypothetical protein
MRPTQPHFQQVPWALSLRHEDDHSPPNGAKAKNVWHYTSASPVCFHGMDFTCSQVIYISFHGWQEAAACSYPKSQIHTQDKINSMNMLNKILYQYKYASKICILYAERKKLLATRCAHPLFRSRQ